MSDKEFFDCIVSMLDEYDVTGKVDFATLRIAIQYLMFDLQVTKEELQTQIRG